MDRGYIDYSRLYKVHQSGAYFVIRAKDNLRFKRMYSKEINKLTGIMCDQIGKLEIPNSLKEYTDKLRRVKYIELFSTG